MHATRSAREESHQSLFSSIKEAEMSTTPIGGGIKSSKRSSKRREDDRKKEEGEEERIKKVLKRRDDFDDNRPEDLMKSSSSKRRDDFDDDRPEDLMKLSSSSSSWKEKPTLPSPPSPNRREDRDDDVEEEDQQCVGECTHLWHAIRNVDIFSNIVEHLNDTDKKLFASASRTSREILKQSFGVDEEVVVAAWDELLKKTKLKISEVSSISTLQLAMEPCVKEYGEEFFLGKVAELDDLTFLRWAREEKGLKWDKWVSSAAAEQGNLEMLKYCFEHGCPLDDYTAVCAAHNGHLGCLKFLIEDAKVDWYDQMACAAAEGGHLEILRYCASKKECQMTSNANVMIFAAFGGHIGCVNYLHQIGVPWSKEVPIYASQAGKIEILERIHELGCPLNEDACSEAALHGHLDLLKFLRNELKCPWDSGTPALASLRGHKEVLQWCFQNDVPICVHSAVNASRNGHVDCLQFLHEHHAPVNGHVVRFARMYEQHECLKFALMNDYPDDITEPMNIWTEMD